MSPPAIRLLEPDANKRGDLFTTLASDLFLCLGYENPRLNIHKGGYELDVKADHAADKSLAVAECKATTDLPGGSDLNKFYGVLDGEKRKAGERHVAGYFVSLFGFKESGVEMEQQNASRFTLLDGPKVVEHLMRGQRLCDFSVATDQAGRCMGRMPDLKLDDTRIVLSHSNGLFWAVCYTRGAVRSHVVLIAADGTPAQAELARSLIAADQNCGGDLHDLICLNPNVQLGKFSQEQVLVTREAWRRYLEHECGFISIEGIPSDEAVASRRFRLEDLFVPQQLNIKGEDDKMIETSVAEALTTHHRLAILAAPGGGKSTLLKRLAVAYADPQRRTLATDQLPDREWFPIFLRCRELRELARRPLGDLLQDLARKDHLSHHSEVFLALAHDALQRGTALLLVDGLDEISDDAARTALVCTLRAALDVWPQTSLVLTSREAGFRHVAPHLAPFCQQTFLATLGEDDIRTLSERWHVQVDGDSAEVRESARQLADRIIGNDRVVQLAGNPLLLTTLFLVKRQTGDLPTGRAKLYAEAVKVLLWSWNVEGHDRISLDDAEPRLAWVAYDMMMAGVQRISRTRLRVSLTAANTVLEDTFGLSRLDPGTFIDRVEYRSSLLMITGKDVEEGRIEDFYEFRHLTFQEYLTARACVESWHAGRTDCDTLADVLQPHLEQEKWKEVIPLAAVLGGRQTAALLTLMIEALRVADPNSKARAPEKQLLVLLLQCLADEAPASPTLIEQAAHCLLVHARSLESAPCIGQFWSGRHGPPVRQFAVTQLDSADWAVPAVHVLAGSIQSQLQAGKLGAIEEAFRHVNSTFLKKEAHEEPSTLLRERVEATLLALLNAFLLQRQKNDAKDVPPSGAMQACHDQLCEFLWSEHLAEQHSAVWAFAWLGTCGSVPTRLFQWREAGATTPLPKHTDIIGRLAGLALRASHPWTREYAGWAIATQPLMAQGRGRFCANLREQDEISMQTLEQRLDEQQRRLASLIVGFYRQRPHTDVELCQSAAESLSKTHLWSCKLRLRELLRLLGAELEAEV